LSSLLGGLSGASGHGSSWRLLCRIASSQPHASGPSNVERQGYGGTVCQ
jgi:hypothetical protein